MKNIFTFARKNIYKFASYTMLILSILYVAILLLKYRNVQILIEKNNDMTAYINSLSNKAGSFSNETNVFSSEEKALYDNFDIETEYLKNISDKIISSYVDKNEFDHINSIIEYIINSSNKNNEYNPDDLSNLVNQLNETIDDNNETIDNLVDIKEDKSNKTTSATEDSENKYPSALTIDNALTSTNENTMSLFNIMYPVGSIYVSLNNEKPLLGVWEKLTVNASLWNTDTEYGQYLSPTLPNVIGSAGANVPAGGVGSAFKSTSVGTSKAGSTLNYYSVTMNFSNCSSIFKNNTVDHPEYSTTVRPAAIAVTMFRRVA